MEITETQEPTMTTSQITETLRSDFPAVNETLVTAVLNGTAMIATTGAGVSPELRDRILQLREISVENRNLSQAWTPPEAFNRMPCGCPLDSGCSGWHNGA